MSETNQEVPDVRPRPETQDPRCWRAEGWTARVIKNENDDGWAVEMVKDGESEPALVGPWTMGRDKKNPKPLDQSAFATLVKTATEVLQRFEQQRRAMLHKAVTVFEGGVALEVTLDIVPDECDPHAILTATDPSGTVLAKRRCRPNYKLTPATATKWVQAGYPSEREA